MINFEDWFKDLCSNYVWFSPATMHHKPETFRSVANKVYMQYVASESFPPIQEARRHVYNKLVLIPGDKVKKDWYKIEEQKKEAEKEWKPASPEHVDKCVAEFDAMMKQSTMVNAFPRIGYKQAVEEGGWLPPKHKPYPMTTEEEAYVRQRHIDYIKANYEPRTGAKLSGWMTEDDFNTLYPDIKTMNFLTKAKEILSPRDLKLINPDDLEESYRCIQKRLRLYRDEIQYSNDKDFVRAKEKRIEMLKVISAELRMLIEGLKPESKEV